MGCKRGETTGSLKTVYGSAGGDLGKIDTGDRLDRCKHIPVNALALLPVCVLGLGFGVGLTLFAAAWLGLAGGLDLALANGGSRPLVTNAISGPYELQIGIFPGDPKVGNLHVSIQVNAADGGAPVTDATVLVSASGPAGAADVPPVQAVNMPQSPQFYETDLPLDAVGSWTLTVETESGLGPATLEVPFQVTEPDGIDIIYVIAGGVALIALSLWILERIGKRQKRKPAKS